jgi:GntR family transcriptional regulator
MTSSLAPDNHRLRRDGSPLYVQTRRHLLRLIADGAFPPGSRLPREEELARSLGVSRPTVREALALLQIDGVVTRRHGAGNFVNHIPPAMAARLDTLISLPQIITANGFSPRMTDLKIDSVDASAAVARALGLRRRAKVHRVRRLCLASGRPAVLITDLLPDRVLGSRDRWRAFGGDMLEFLRDVCGAPVTYAVAVLEVRPADTATATALRIPAGEGILRITQTAYTTGNSAVVYSTGDHRPGMITYSLLRMAR